MKVSEPKESLKPVWDQFVGHSPNGSLTQSWAWGEFNQSLGDDVTRLAVSSSSLSSNRTNFLEARSSLLATALYIKRTVKSINYWYAPYGPVVSEIKTEAAFTALMSKTYQLAKEKGIDFIRLEPKFSLNDYLMVKPTDDVVQAQNTLVVDISREEEEILASMKSKHRYNIRLAEKKGVKVRKAETVEEIDNFWRLLKQNSEDNNFSIHEKQYYQKQLDILSGQGMEELFLATKDKKVIAANLIGFYGDSAYYLHGAMDREFSSLMAPHLLQWKAMLVAKKKGCQRYDLFGVAPDGAKKDHSWQGFTRFKKGFAPDAKLTHYPGNYFIPINKLKYYLFSGLKKVKNYFDL